MQRKSLTPLGETEMEVLHHVWSMERATVAQVHDKILKNRKVAYTTIMTVMKKLADKGYLSYEKDGSTYVYQPAKSKDQVQQGLIDNLVEKAFNGSPAALIQTLVKRESLTEEELEDIRKLIEDLDDHANH